MDDKLHRLHKDKSVVSAHWGDAINAPVKAKMKKFSTHGRDQLQKTRRVNLLPADNQTGLI